MKKIFRANFFTTGLAMFAMFFGSGNLIFPVGIGQMAGEQNAWAMAGLFITAILLPFFTLILMLLHDGDYNRFFSNIGYVPGKIIAFTTLALIGPFGVLPRCVAFSYATFSIYFESVSLLQFSTVSCILVFLLSVKKNDVVGIIGNLLTPILLASLAVIIISGLGAEHIPLATSDATSNLAMMGRGFLEGYKTFDIFAALFFATAIIPALHVVLGPNLQECKSSLIRLTLKSSLVGMALLFIIYGGLSFVAANLRGGLEGVPGEKLLGIISTITLGEKAGLFANLVVSFACLTTAISLALVSAEFFKKDIFQEKISYFQSLLLCMIITYAFSLMGFEGIMNLVTPILKVICPAVIMLIISVGLNYFYGFRYIKAPVYAVFFVSLLVNIFY